MVKSLLIHLGGHKSGSTSIQSVLARQGWDSAHKSLLYPAVTKRREQQKSKGNHAALAITLFKGGVVGQRDKRFASVATRLAASDADLAVLSAERFEYVNPQLMQEVVAKHFPDLADSARYIVYVRPHADRLVSAYSERVKHGVFSGNLAEFYARITPADGAKSFFYHPQFLPWKQCFGDRFSLRPMIRDRLKDQDVVTDFLDFAFDGAAFRLTGAAARNPSLSLEDLVMIREFHRITGGTGNDKPSEAQNSAGVRLARYLGELAAARQTRIAMDRALAEQVVATWAEDAAALDREFFDDTPMTDALVAAPGKALAEPQSIAPEDHFAPESLRLIRAWSALLGEVLNESEQQTARRKARLQTAAGVNAARATGEAEKPGRGKIPGKGRKPGRRKA